VPAVVYFCVLQYLVMMLSLFALMAWFGSLIDNLLLTYLIGTNLIFIINCNNYIVLKMIRKIT